MLLSAAFSVLLLSLSTAEITLEEGVLVLDNDNFQVIVKNIIVHTIHSPP